MKMNELGVFNTPVYLRGNTIGHQWGDYARFSNEQQARAAAHAINNHDRMVEEIAELRKGLEIMIEQFESDHNCEYEYNIIKWNKDLLAKLNQEGEE